jgi:hypothetical protein
MLSSLTEKIVPDLTEFERNFKFNSSYIETAGLAEADQQRDHPEPHIILKPHPWRRLKTQGSEPIVPLVGVSL